MSDKTLYAAFGGIVEEALTALVGEGILPADATFRNVTLEPPRDASHGDLATNAAMVLAKPAKTNPRALAEAIADSDAFSVAGGGDTLAAIDKYGVADRISYISTGGGAFLEFVEGKTLPAVAILEERANG